MVKSLELIEKLTQLEQNSDVDESTLYFHRGLHKPLKSQNPLNFQAASGNDKKLFGKDAIVHHDVTPEGITKSTHVITKSASNPNPGAFEHHFFDYHTSGSKAGSIKTQKTTAYASKQSAVDAVTASRSASSTSKFMDRVATGVKDKTKTKVASFLKSELPSYGKRLAKDIAKSVVPF